MGTLSIHFVLRGSEYVALVAHPAEQHKARVIASLNAGLIKLKPSLLDDFKALVKNAVSGVIEANGAGPVLEVRTIKVEDAPV